MKRLPSTLSLAAWLGFSATSAVTMLGAMAPSREEAEAAAFVSAGLVAASLLVVAALAHLHRTDHRDRQMGERLGLCGLGLVALVAILAGSHSAFPFDVTGTAFWALLALSAGAIVFDGRITLEEGEESMDDEKDFLAGLAALAESMARPPRHPSSGISAGPSERDR